MLNFYLNKNILCVKNGYTTAESGTTKKDKGGSGENIIQAGQR